MVKERTRNCRAVLTASYRMFWKLTAWKDIVTSYLRFCECVCVPTKTFCTCNDNQPWITVRLRQLCPTKADREDTSRVQAGQKLWQRRSDRIKAAPPKSCKYFLTNNHLTGVKAWDTSVNYRRPSPSFPLSGANKNLADDLNVVRAPHPLQLSKTPPL